VWQTYPGSAIIHGSDVTSTRKKRSKSFPWLPAIASWILLQLNSPAAYASGVALGVLAVWLGVTLYRRTRQMDEGFTAAANGMLSASSGLTSAAVALGIWALVWPQVAARRATQDRAHLLLSNITMDTNATVAAAEPVFSKPGGIYQEGVSVSLASPGSDAILCYTTDGSEPTTKSPVYDGPIAVHEPLTINAKTFRKGFQPSATASETYFVADRDLANFNSNLPLIIINSAGKPIMQQPKTRVFARFINIQNNGRSRLNGASDYTGDAELHLHGSSTLRFPKRSYSLSLGSSKTDKQKASIFDMPKDSDWILYAPYQDKTLMRDVLAYELSRQMGHYASRTKFVELFLHTGSGRLTRDDYMGVYVFEEKIKRGKNRVNVESLTRNDNSEPNISGGYIFKRDHADRNENGFYTRYGGPYYYVYPKQTEITSEQRRWLHDYMNRFENALY